MLLGVVFDKDGDLMHSISYDSLDSSLSSKKIEDSTVRMRYPFKSDMEGVRLFGSCNGLIFLWLYDHPKSKSYTDNDDSDSHTDCSVKGLLCVWNPATGEYKKIPKSPNTYLRTDVCIHGLAYDCKKDDYKFVIGISSEKTGLSTSVEIFSLKSNLWETIQTPYSTYDDRKPGVLVNGDLHWLAKGEYGICIVYLDFSNDTPSFKEIQLPSVPNLEFITVGVLEEGCLCVVSDNGDPSGLGRVQLWEMKDYEVHESWTKRYIIANEKITKAVMIKDFGLKIMRSSKNGKILFVDFHNVVLYDPKHKSAIERKLGRLAYFTSEVNYSESLVSLNSGTYVSTERI